MARHLPGGTIGTRARHCQRSRFQQTTRSPCGGLCAVESFCGRRHTQSNRLCGRLPTDSLPIQGRRSNMSFCRRLARVTRRLRGSGSRRNQRQETGYGVVPRVAQSTQAARAGVRTSVRRRQNSFYGYTNTTTVGTTDRSKMRRTTGGELWALWSPIRPGDAYGGRDTFPYTKVQDGVHSRGISSGSAEGRRGVRTASQWPEEIQQKLHGPSSLEDAWTVGAAQFFEAIRLLLQRRPSRSVSVSIATQGVRPHVVFHLAWPMVSLCGLRLRSDVLTKGLHRDYSTADRFSSNYGGSVDSTVAGRFLGQKPGPVRVRKSYNDFTGMASEVGILSAREEKHFATDASDQLARLGLGFSEAAISFASRQNAQYTVYSATNSDIDSGQVRGTAARSGQSARQVQRRQERDHGNSAVHTISNSSEAQSHASASEPRRSPVYSGQSWRRLGRNGSSSAILRLQPQRADLVGQVSTELERQIDTTRISRFGGIDRCSGQHRRGFSAPAGGARSSRGRNMADSMALERARTSALHQYTRTGNDRDGATVNGPRAPGRSQRRQSTGELRQFSSGIERRSAGWTSSSFIPASRTIMALVDSTRNPRILATHPRQIQYCGGPRQSISRRPLGVAISANSLDNDRASVRATFGGPVRVSFKRPMPGLLQSMGRSNGPRKRCIQASSLDRQPIREPAISGDLACVASLTLTLANSVRDNGIANMAKHAMVVRRHGHVGRGTINVADRTTATGSTVTVVDRAAPLADGRVPIMRDALTARGLDPPAVARNLRQ